jgi:polysaccharide export outer membrane protein
MVISGLLSQEFKLMSIVENIPGVCVVWLREKLGAPVNWHSTDPSQSFKLTRAKKMIFTALTGMALLLSLSALGLTQVHAQASAVSLPLDSQWTKMNEPSSAEVPLKTPGAQALSLSDDNATASSARMAEATSGPDRLLVGVGDQIFITVFGQPDMSAEVTVNENQQVTLPLVGTIRVGALTPSAIEKLVAKRLKDGEYLRNPEVSVQVRQVRSQMISVLGEVQRPGRFPILGKLTVLDALATAGGLTQRADRTVFLLRRNPLDGGAIQRREIAIHLDSVLDSSKGELDIELKHDDVVFVAQQKMFYVHGEVRRPGAYPIEPDLNIMRVLSISGGVTERGSMRRIRIHRKGPDDKSVQELTQDLSAPVRSGDVIHVDERLF